MDICGLLPRGTVSFSMIHRLAGQTISFTIASNPHSLSHDRAVQTYQDPSGRVWVGAGTVINLWDPTTRSFTRYPNIKLDRALVVEPIGSDRNGRLWVTYDFGGLSILDPSSGEYTNFDVSDGVCGHVVDMENLEDGRVLLTGGGGLNILNPDSIDTSSSPAFVGHHQDGDQRRSGCPSGTQRRVRIGAAFSRAECARV